MCIAARRPDGGGNDRIGALRSCVAPAGDREKLAFRLHSRAFSNRESPTPSRCRTGLAIRLPVVGRCHPFARNHSWLATRSGSTAGSGDCHYSPLSSLVFWRPPPRPAPALLLS